MVVAISISLLIASLSIAYYYVYYIPQKDRQKIEQQKFEMEQKRKDEQAKQQSLQSCLDEADTTYHDTWTNMCKKQGRLSDECIELLDMKFDEYAEKNSIPQDKRLQAIDEFYDKRDECSCLLPHANAETISGYRTEASEECFRKFGN